MHRSLICAFLLALIGMPVLAQPTHTLDIRDERVLVNGRLVPADELPPTLDVHGVTAQFSFTGSSVPVVELNGRLYAIADGTLREVERPASESDGISVFFRDDLQSSVAPARSPRPVASRPSRQAAQQEMRQYLDAVRTQNRELYERLVREWRLEREVQALAAEIQSLPEREARQHVAQLRDRLEEIFELKQTNRRREIQQLEQQLDALRERVQRREELRQQLIDQRLYDLTGYGTARDK
jgi:hypothetical protein